MTNHRSIRRERRIELDEQIAFRKRRIADDTAVLHDLLRQSGMFDAGDRMAASIFEDGALDNFRSQGSEGEAVPPSGREVDASSTAAQPTCKPSIEAYVPSLIDKDRFARLTDKQADYKRLTLLKMVEILESNYPAPVKASDINRSIEELDICSKPTFAKLKTAFVSSGLVQFDGSKKTWSIPEPS